MKSYRSAILTKRYGNVTRGGPYQLRRAARRSIRPARPPTERARPAPWNASRGCAHLIRAALRWPESMSAGMKKPSARPWACSCRHRLCRGISGPGRRWRWSAAGTGFQCGGICWNGSAWRICPRRHTARCPPDRRGGCTWCWPWPTDPVVVVLDEPTAGLDVEGRSQLHGAVRELKDQGMTFLLATHDMAEAEMLCDRIAIIIRGRLITLGTPAQVTAAGSRETKITIHTEKGTLLPGRDTAYARFVSERDGYGVWASAQVSKAVPRAAQSNRGSRRHGHRPQGRAPLIGGAVPGDRRNGGKSDMKAFITHLGIQLRLDFRNKGTLLVYYIIPLVFYLVMGAVFSSIMPDNKETLGAAMSIFGITMGAVLGLPPALVEMRQSGTLRAYRVNGVPGMGGTPHQIIERVLEPDRRIRYHRRDGTPALRRGRPRPYRRVLCHHTIAGGREHRGGRTDRRIGEEPVLDHNTLPGGVPSLPALERDHVPRLDAA